MLANGVSCIGDVVEFVGVVEYTSCTRSVSIVLVLYFCRDSLLI